MGIENKVRVAAVVGAGSWLGVMSPRPGMTTDRGDIVSVDTGGATVKVSGVGSSANTTYYPHQLFVSLAVATGTFSYPTGDGSVVWGRSATWPNGVPDLAETGMYYKLGVDRGYDVGAFSRP